MAENPRTAKHTTPDATDVEQLRVDAQAARAAGDTARAAQLEERIRQAEAK